MPPDPFVVADVMTTKVVAVLPGAVGSAHDPPDRPGRAEVRSEVVGHLFPLSAGQIHVRVDAGVVTLSGEVRDRARIPLAARLARAVEGVVDVRCALTAPDQE
ncbi:BON domain-containing protein [Streptomyces sp. NPDC056463]|uniref:BON domain-containing protein n=1 Tax=Streptomyces sp. NPDC056463 TaxID=3345827 RepID=UPI0036960BED